MSQKAESSLINEARVVALQHVLALSSKRHYFENECHRAGDRSLLPMANKHDPSNGKEHSFIGRMQAARNETWFWADLWNEMNVVPPRTKKKTPTHPLMINILPITTESHCTHTQKKRRKISSASYGEGRIVARVAKGGQAKAYKHRTSQENELSVPFSSTKPAVCAQNQRISSYLAKSGGWGFVCS